MRISGYLADGKKNAKVLAGGGAKGETGWFVEPTLIQTEDPAYRLMCEEIFGPVVTAYVYDDAKWHETLKIVDSTSPYALTGAVFARERQGDPRGARRAAQCGGKLLRQRQAHRRGGRPAAVRRRARLGHQRQGGFEAEPPALGEREDGEGDLRPRRPNTTIHSWMPSKPSLRHARRFHVDGRSAGISSRSFPTRAGSPRMTLIRITREFNFSEVTFCYPPAESGAHPAGPDLHAGHARSRSRATRRSARRSPFIVLG